MLKRLPWLILSFLIIIVFGAGCEEEEGILDQFAGERLALVLETTDHSEAYYYQPQLETALINYIERHYDLQVVNPRLFMKRQPQWEGRLEEFCRDELGLDYLLTIGLENIVVDEPSPRMDLRPKSFYFKVTTTCSLTLTYTLENLRTGGIIYFGQSNGSSREESRVKVGKHGVHLDLNEINYYDLIEDAMFRALRRTELL
ncbi:MAG: hypothetical protein GX081_01130 [Firmicutes bacterium]|nr:hypothetical protein [Bacillota bacterium]